MMAAPALQQLNREFGIQVVGVLCDFDAPEGFVPGQNDDGNKGYGVGSEIMTRDGRYFICRDGAPGKAVWIELMTGARQNVIRSIDLTPEQIEKLMREGQWTEGSFPERFKEEYEQKPTTERGNPASPDVEEVEHSEGGQSVSKPQVPDNPNILGLPYIPDAKDTSDEIPKDMPYRFFITDKMRGNGITSMFILRKLWREGKISELRYMNEKRIAAINEYLKNELSETQNETGPAVQN